MYQSLIGHRYTYHHQNGLRLVVDLFRLKNLDGWVKDHESYIIMVASNPILRSFIFGRSRPRSDIGGRGFTIWEGIAGFDAEGWAKEETIFKTRGQDQTARSPRIRPSIYRYPAVNVLDLLPSRPGAGPNEEPRTESRRIDKIPPIQWSHDDHQTTLPTTEVIEITDEESAIEDDENEHGLGGNSSSMLRH